MRFSAFLIAEVLVKLCDHEKFENFEEIVKKSEKTEERKKNISNLAKKSQD